MKIMVGMAKRRARAKCCSLSIFNDLSVVPKEIAVITLVHRLVTKSIPLDITVDDERGVGTIIVSRAMVINAEVDEVVGLPNMIEVPPTPTLSDHVMDVSSPTPTSSPGLELVTPHLSLTSTVRPAEHGVPQVGPHADALTPRLFNAPAAASLPSTPFSEPSFFHDLPPVTARASQEEMRLSRDS